MIFRVSLSSIKGDTWWYYISLILINTPYAKTNPCNQGIVIHPGPTHLRHPNAYHMNQNMLSVRTQNLGCSSDQRRLQRLPKICQWNRQDIFWASPKHFQSSFTFWFQTACSCCFYRSCLLKYFDPTGDPMGAHVTNPSPWIGPRAARHQVSLRHKASRPTAHLNLQKDMSSYIYIYCIILSYISTACHPKLWGSSIVVIISINLTHPHCKWVWGEIRLQLGVPYCSISPPNQFCRIVIASTFLRGRGFVRYVNNLYQSTIEPLIHLLGGQNNNTI